MAPPKLYTRRSATTTQTAVKQKAPEKANVKTPQQANGSATKRPSEETQPSTDSTVSRAKKKRRIEVEVVSDGSPSSMERPMAAEGSQQAGRSAAVKPPATSTRAGGSGREGDAIATSAPRVQGTRTLPKIAEASKIPTTKASAKTTVPNGHSSTASASTSVKLAQPSAAPSPLRRTQTSPPKPVQKSVTQLKDSTPKTSRSSTPSSARAVDSTPMDVDASSTSSRKAPSSSRTSKPASKVTTTTARPRTRARDLSSLFSECLPSTSQPNSAAPSPTKLARRMLGRSKTESSIASAGHASLFDSPSSSQKSLGVAELMPNIIVDCADASQPQDGTPRILERTPGTPRAESLRRADSTPSIPHSPPRVSDSERAKPQPHPGKTIRTYAGASRSFLMAIPVSAATDPTQNPVGAPIDLSSLADPTPPDEQPDSVPYSTLHAMYLPTDDDNMMDPLMKSITDLRSKGEARRWADEAGYLLEGLEPDAPIGLRRASALDIAKKLAVDEEVWEKAKRADDFFGTVWTKFVSAGAGVKQVEKADFALDALLAAFVALVSRDEEALEELANQPDFGEILFRVMERARKVDVLSEQEAQPGVRLSKKEKAFVASMKETLSPRLASICEPEHPSTIALVEYVFSQVAPSHLPSSRATDIARSMQACLKTDKSSFATPNVHRVSRLLPLLDSFLLGQWNSSQSAITQDILDTEEWLAPALLSLLKTSPHSANSKGKARADINSDSTTSLHNLALRILTTLTHASKTWCKRVESAHGVRILGALMRACADAEPSEAGRAMRLMVKRELGVKMDVDGSDDSPAEKEDGRQDTLYIALALLTNLAQELGACEGMDDDVIGTLLRLHARGSATARSGHAREPSQDVDEAAREAERIYVPGHLAVLLGMLMRDSKRVRDKVLRGLSDSGDLDGGVKLEEGAGLRRLADDARTFVDIWVFAIGAARDERSTAEGELATEVLAFYETLGSTT
ncbi:hypothetical protein FB107DRAFT_270803 [Schizophyllum commune]